jgi:hypothetical protein
MPPAAYVNKSNARIPMDGARLLQDRLHELISRLTNTMDIIKQWPESSYSSGHNETTTQCMVSVRTLLQAVDRVEGVIVRDAAVRQALQDCRIPLDLLDLLDHGSGGLNPECFCRGLLQEAQAQLAGLKRRKHALERLGATIQDGLAIMTTQDAVEEALMDTSAHPLLEEVTVPLADSKKRHRNEQEALEDGEDGEEEESERPTKKAHVDSS